MNIGGLNNMIFDIAMVGFTWLFIIGFIVLAACITSDNTNYNSKVYKDLEETIRNRNENV